jgi:hypothetical protein
LIVFDPAHKDRIKKSFFVEKARRFLPASARDQEHPMAPDLIVTDRSAAPNLKFHCASETGVNDDAASSA